MGKVRMILRRLIPHRHVYDTLVYQGKEHFEMQCYKCGKIKRFPYPAGMRRTCKQCVWFTDTSENGNPILDECVCWLPGGGKNYFLDMEPCDKFDDIMN